MACCVVAALFLAVAHRLTPWRRRGPDIAGFAPQAGRPAPGQGGAPVDVPDAAMRLRPRTAALAWIARFVAVGAVLYLIGTALLLRVGTMQSQASASLWIARTIAMLVPVIAAMVLSARIFRRGTDPSTRRQLTGYAAIGIALMAIEGMAFDMHVLAVYSIPSLRSHLLAEMGSYAVLTLGIAAVLLPPRQPSKAA